MLPHMELAVVDEEGLAQLLQDPLGHPVELKIVAGVFDEHGELVPAEAGHGVAGPHARLQPLGHLDEQPVAGGVAEAVVDLLEPSRSRNSTATDGVRRMLRCRACSTRSLNMARLAREVNESWKAWWDSWSSSWRCSEMSRVLSTSPRCSLACSSAVRSTTRDSRWRASERFSSRLSTWRQMSARMMNDRIQDTNRPSRPC
jgi:hypothetical protein